MPITATLSRKFYDKLGDEVTNELVTWLNTVDQSYREEFRELFTVQFSQFKAEMDARMAEMDARLIALRSEVMIALANQKVDLYDRIGQGERRLLVWMIGLWLSTPLATAGIVLALKHLGWL